MALETKESLSEELEKLNQNLYELKSMQSQLEAKKMLSDIIFDLGKKVISGMEDHRKELLEKLAAIK